MGGTKREVIKVPPNLQGKVIGRGGDTLRDIENDYEGVKIIMPPRDSKSEDVVIEGPKLSVEAAKNRVLDICGLAPDLPDGDRARADKLYDEMNELYDQMRAAGSKAEKNKLRTAAEKKRSEAEKANEEAARATFKLKNLGYGKEQMDLHGLRVKEALMFVEERLVAVDGDLRSGKLESLNIITGFGHHSDNGKAKIKPEVAKLLTERGYPFEGDKAGGQFIVQFPQGDGGASTKPTAKPADGGGAGPADEVPKRSGFLSWFKTCCLMFWKLGSKTEQQEGPTTANTQTRKKSPDQQNMTRN